MLKRQKSTVHVNISFMTLKTSKSTGVKEATPTKRSLMSNINVNADTNANANNCRF